MQRIYFANNRKNTLLLFLLLLAVIGGLIGAFELIPFENPRWNKYLLGISSLSNAVFVSHFFWYKNYVQWTKRSIMIKVKSWSGKNINFEDVTALTFESGILKITKQNDGIEQFNLNHIMKEDCSKLCKIIQEHTSLSD